VCRCRPGQNCIDLLVGDPSNATTKLTSVPTLLATPVAGPEPWIIGAIIGGVALVAIVAGLAIYFLLKRRHAQQLPAKNVIELKQPAGKSEYGDLLFVAPDAAASKIAGNQNVHADKSKSSQYSANTADLTADILPESNYGLIRDTDLYAKSATEFKVGVSQEPNYAEINDADFK